MRVRPTISVGSIVLLLSFALAGCAGPSVISPEPDGKGLVLRCVPTCAVSVDVGASNPREPTLAVNPSDPQNLVGVATHVSHDVAGNPHWWNHVYVSKDRGRSWASSPLPGGLGADPTHPLAATTDMADASVMILNDGTVLVAGMAWNYFGRYTNEIPLGAVNSQIFVARSSDGGKSFRDVATVDAPRGGTVAGQYAYWADKPALSADDHGTILLGWERWDRPTDPPSAVYPITANVMWSASTDKGMTWTAPAAVPGLPATANDWYWGVGPSVGRDGTWRMSFLQLGDDYSGRLRLATSHDRGGNWQIETLDPAAAFGFPNLVAATGPDGAEHLYVGYAVPVGSDREAPVLRTSHDGGATWSAALVLDEPTAAGTFIIPSMGVDGQGTVFFGFYKHAADSTMDYQFVAVEKDRIGKIKAFSGIRGPMGPLGDFMGMAGLPSGAAALYVTDIGSGPDLVGASLIVDP